MTDLILERITCVDEFGYGPFERE